MAYVAPIFFFLLGIASGLGIGRFFCKWHHKDDVKSNICCQTTTIGEEIEKGGCSPGCCGDKE